ncbi:hypothetical protein [Christiangramia forsetii]|uniref:Uncharacterized protein n=2 Tax=Christiangramia forsetii TaxID=411153 RepID=A0M3S8_CHRFK|nr:hypothetical protein [Christiangramia forsetii]GGG25071.1 hypothetical protein GCM10011532_05520 [Christiangramia forsetii]CAL67273.1 conserved hypothetical protein [Christiangramia forsetii KT0803]
MKKPLLIIIACLFLQSCWLHRNDERGDINPVTSSFEPLTIDREIFESTIAIGAPREIEEAGKIYVNGDIVFINELNKGFHVLDNHDPKNPANILFIEIPLATDLAIRNNTIYVHHAVDLVAMRLDANSIEILHRVRNVFPRLNSPDGFLAEDFDLGENQIIIGYQSLN